MTDILEAGSLGWRHGKGCWKGAGSHEVVDALRRPELAALVALALFLVVWPVVFIGAHVSKWRA